VIMNLHHNILCYPLRESECLVCHLQLHIGGVLLAFLSIAT
jgi:hypothetical protein